MLSSYVSGLKPGPTRDWRRRFLLFSRAWVRPRRMDDCRVTPCRFPRCPVRLTPQVGPGFSRDSEQEPRENSAFRFGVRSAFECGAMAQL